jgi:hypothetical protein
MPPQKSPKTVTATPASVTTAPPDASTPAPLADPDTIAAYRTLYDTLGRAYWEASDINSKDIIQGARDAIYDILTDLNIAQLQANTALFLALIPRVRQINVALSKIEDDIAGITKNINTASSVIASITKILTIVGKI